MDRDSEEFFFDVIRKDEFYANLPENLKIFGRGDVAPHDLLTWTEDPDDLEPTEEEQDWLWNQWVDEFIENFEWLY
ncbi:hypothetical protein [Sulfobacillus thermosulfidooxidans]|uniref:hypothetical protein n=1 Tax=Sulfobacillus thermosulfidooxidans TaxID=28034 RepID=UPI00031BB3DC|nr:hypothetical protein [Sulfobacillus thermosulfidooxidans]